MKLLSRSPVVAEYCVHLRQVFQLGLETAADVIEQAQFRRAQLAIAWILRRPEVTSCIVGASKPEQLVQNAQASGLKLSEEIIRRIEDVMA